MKNNRITNIPVDQVEHLGLLRYLEISGNLLLEIYFIRYIPGLRSVFLSQNLFPSTNILPVEVRNLEILVLTKTEIEEFPMISGLRKFLQKIDLNWNKISCVNLVHLSNMTRLETLLMGYDRIHKFPDSDCAPNNSSINTIRDWRFPSLKSVFLRCNKLTEVPNLPDAGLLSCKVTVDLSANWISHVSVERLASLKHGANLNLILSHNRITDMPNLSVVGPALISAFLIANNIAYLSCDHLTGLINLKTLCLSSNRIANFDFSVLLILPSLSKICFDDNSLSIVSIPNTVFENTSLTITLDNNPIFCDKQFCLLVAEAPHMLQLTCAAPEKHNGRTLVAYYILMCSEYSIHHMTPN